MTAAPASGYEADTLALLARAAARTAPPPVRALHLPPQRPDDPLAGESCALELDDGSIGLSYVLFGDTLAALRTGAPALPGRDALDCARGYALAPTAVNGAARTLGFAAANALTAWMYRRAGYVPPPATGSLGGLDPSPGEAVGMVGYFAPLAPRLLERGARLVVLELREALHGVQDGVRVTGEMEALAPCTQVLCTGTALLNGTLPDLLAACPRARRFALVGPSAGGLPDALFARGVTTLGGSWIEDGPAFLAALESGARRGASARKFEIDVRGYPGFEALLARF